MISIVVPFWSDELEGSLRERNVLASWPMVKLMYRYLLDAGIECDCTLYDFSNKKLVYDAVWVPTDIGGFNKTKRLNLCLPNHEYSDFIFCLDADMFFNPTDFHLVLEVIKNLIPKQSLVTFDAAKLYEQNTKDFIATGKVDYEWDWWYAYSGNKSLGPLAYHNGGLGGAYIVATSLLKSAGWFDESFETWGGEDGKAYDDINKLGVELDLVRTTHFAPFHLNHDERDRLKNIWDIT